MAAGEHVVVDGKDCTKRDCYLEALRLDPNNFKAWNNLGFSMAAGEHAVVDGKDCTKRECYLEALQHDPNTRLRGTISASA